MVDSPAAGAPGDRPLQVGDLRLERESDALRVLAQPAQEVTVPITVQLPQVASTQVETAAILAPQQTLVLALPELHGRRCIVTVQVEPAAAAAPARAASDR